MYNEKHTAGHAIIENNPGLCGRCTLKYALIACMQNMYKMIDTYRKLTLSKHLLHTGIAYVQLPQKGWGRFPSWSVWITTLHSRVQIIKLKRTHFNAIWECAMYRDWWGGCMGSNCPAPLSGREWIRIVMFPKPQGFIASLERERDDYIGHEPFSNEYWT
jgi:hypothetical protein